MEVVPGTPEDQNGSGRGLSTAGKWFAACLIVLLCLWTLVVRTVEASIVFAPSKYPNGDWDAPKRSKYKVDDVYLKTADEVTIHGWYVHAKANRPEVGSGSPRVILYFHGNAGSLAGRLQWMEALAVLGLDVFGIDYHGYGRSGGSPSEESFYLDGDAAYGYLVDEMKFRPSDVLVYGKSVGGGPACEVATQNPVAGLVLQSAFTSLPDMAGAFAPIIPSRYFLATSFNNLEKVETLEIPKLVIHSRDDDLIPFWMGERLYERAAEPKIFRPFSGAGHNDLIFRERDGILRGFRDLIAQVQGAR